MEVGSQLHIPAALYPKKNSGSHRGGGWMSECVWKMLLKQTLKCFGLIRFSSCTPLEMYASSGGYRQFKVSALPFYVSLKIPSAKNIVELHCLVGCTVSVCWREREASLMILSVRGVVGVVCVSIEYSVVWCRICCVLLSLLQNMECLREQLENTA